MNYADIAIIVIMVLSLILGLAKGFWRTFSKAVTLIGALALGFMLAAKLSPHIFNEGVLTKLNGMTAKLVLSNEASQGVVQLFGSELHVYLGGETISLSEGLSKMLVPSFLQGAIIASAAALPIETLQSGITLGSLVSSAYTHMIAMFLSGLIIFLVALIVLRVVARLIYNAINTKNGHKTIDRILGGALRLVTGMLFILIVFYVIELMSGFSFMAPVMDVINSGKISGPLYKADLFNKIFFGEGFANILDTFTKYIPLNVG